MKSDSPHGIAVTPHPGRVRILFAGRTVVDTTRALALAEGSMRPVLYVPREDADMGFISKTAHHTECPYKGEASYFTFYMNGDMLENAVWSYEAPLPGVSAIAGHLAFYPDQVEIRQG